MELTQIQWSVHLHVSLFNIYCYSVRFVFRAIDFVHEFAQYQMYQNKYDCYYYGSFLWISERISKQQKRKNE